MVPIQIRLAPRPARATPLPNVLLGLYFIYYLSYTWLSEHMLLIYMELDIFYPPPRRLLALNIALDLSA
jgi:hypothetical protein